MKTFLIAVAGGLMLMLFCVAAAFKIRDYKEEIRYIKMEIQRSDDPDEFEYWQNQLEMQYARINPFRRWIKK